MHKEVFDALEEMVKKHCPVDEAECYTSLVERPNKINSVYFLAIKTLVRYGRMELWMQSGELIRAKFRSDNLR